MEYELTSREITENAPPKVDFMTSEKFWLQILGDVYLNNFYEVFDKVSSSNFSHRERNSLITFLTFLMRFCVCLSIYCFLMSFQ